MPGLQGGRQVGVLHDELHRRVLALARLAHRPRCPGVDDEVGVAGGVHEGAGADRLRPPLGGDDDGLDPLAVTDHVGHQGVQQQP